jgi:hypothetical protein
VPSLHSATNRKSTCIPSICIPWRRGAKDIASGSEVEDPGSNPDKAYGFREYISTLLCILDVVC